MGFVKVSFHRLFFNFVIFYFLKIKKKNQKYTREFIASDFISIPFLLLLLSKLQHLNFFSLYTMRGKKYWKRIGENSLLISNILTYLDIYIH